MNIELVIPKPVSIKLDDWPLVEGNVERGDCAVIYHRDPSDDDEDIFLISPQWSKWPTNYFTVHDCYHEYSVCRYIPGDVILEVEWNRFYTKENLIIKFFDEKLIQVTA